MQGPYSQGKTWKMSGREKNVREMSGKCQGILVYKKQNVREMSGSFISNCQNVREMSGNFAFEIIFNYFLILHLSCLSRIFHDSHMQETKAYKRSIKVSGKGANSSGKCQGKVREFCSPNFVRTLTIKHHAKNKYKVINNNRAIAQYVENWLKMGSHSGHFEFLKNLKMTINHHTKYDNDPMSGLRDTAWNTHTHTHSHNGSHSSMY